MITPGSAGRFSDVVARKRRKISGAHVGAVTLAALCACTVVLLSEIMLRVVVVLA